MAFKIFRKRFTAIKFKRLSIKAIKNQEETQRRKTWTGISHGFHIVEKGGNADGSVLAQREQVEGSEFWLLGAFDQQMSSGVTKYLQSHLFDKKLSEDRIRRKAKEIMKKACIYTKATVQEGMEANDIKGCATVLVMNGKRFVAAHFGGYEAVVCRDGMATQIGMKHQRRKNGKWSLSDILQMKCASNGDHKPHKSQKLVVTDQKVEMETEFIILASDGVWEVMRNQEAVDLVSHIEDAQKAAECLAEEALVRLSKSTISCIVLRFH